MQNPPANPTSQLQRRAPAPRPRGRGDPRLQERVSQGRDAICCVLLPCGCSAAPSRAISSSRELRQLETNQLSELLLLQLNSETWQAEQHPPKEPQREMDAVCPLPPASVRGQSCVRGFITRGSGRVLAAPAQVLCCGEVISLPWLQRGAGHCYFSGCSTRCQRDASPLCPHGNCSRRAQTGTEQLREHREQSPTTCKNPLGALRAASCPALQLWGCCIHRRRGPSTLVLCARGHPAPWHQHPGAAPVRIWVRDPPRHDVGSSCKAGAQLEEWVDGVLEGEGLVAALPVSQQGQGSLPPWHKGWVVMLCLQPKRELVMGEGRWDGGSRVQGAAGRWGLRDGAVSSSQRRFGERWQRFGEPAGPQPSGAAPEAGCC